MSRPTTPLPPSGSANTDPITSPPRSSTFHHGKPKRSHVPQQPHRTHRQHAEDRSVPQSAVVAPSHNPFGEFLTKTKSSLADPFPPTSSTLVGLGGTRTPERLDPQDAVKDSNDREEEEERRRKEEETKQKWKEARALKAKREDADEDLRSTLAQLSNLSSMTTRRLDTTYYSLLSSLSALRLGVRSLHALSRSTHQLNDKFAHQTEEVTRETTAAIQRIEEQFQRQSERIEGLEARLQAGRVKVGGLSERLDVVRENVEAAAERDGEGRRRVRGMWRMGWTCIAGLLLLIFGVAIWQKGGADGIVSLGGGSAGDNFWDLEMKKGTLGAEDLKRGLEGLRGPGQSNASLGDMETMKDTKEARSTKSVEAEATLRLLDEL